MRARLEKLCGRRGRAVALGRHLPRDLRQAPAHPRRGGRPEAATSSSTTPPTRRRWSRARSRISTSTRSGSPRAPSCRASTSRSRKAAVPTTWTADSYVDDLAVKIYRTLRGAPARGQRRRLRGPHPARGEAARAGAGEGDRIRRRFDYVLVDEFQDTNAIQYRFLRDAGAGPQEPVRRRRRRPEHLPLARRRRAQHPRLPARLPRRDQS